MPSGHFTELLQGDYISLTHERGAPVGFLPMRNLPIPLLMVVILSVVTTFRVCADESKLAGVWVNTNEDTRACPKFEISLDNHGAATFVWWGKTGKTQTPYGPFPLSISGSGATAEHITKFSEMQFTVELSGRGAVLTMETEYTDDSGRDDFELEEKFEKKE